MVVRVHLRCIPYLVVKVALDFGKKRKDGGAGPFGGRVVHLYQPLLIDIIFIYLYMQRTVQSTKYKV